MIVIFNVSLYRIGFMFRTAERTFATVECVFRTAEYTFRSAEHKPEAVFRLIQNAWYEHFCSLILIQLDGLFAS